jgi:hypothetical protein
VNQKRHRSWRKHDRGDMMAVAAMSRARIVDELAKIAFSDIRNS